MGRRLATTMAAIAAQTPRSSTAQRASAWTRTTNHPLAVLPTTREMVSVTTTTTWRLATTMAAIAVGQTLERLTAQRANAWIPTTCHRKNRTVATRLTRATATATTTTTRRLATTMA